MKLADAAACLGCEGTFTDIWVTGAAIDSRAVKSGDLFFCLPGERVDGHDYALKAAENGAAAIVATRQLNGLPVPVLLVDDASRALGELARYWRGRTKARVICLTGTAGKTTLKDLLASILASAGSCSATIGNHNNQLGLPLTVLNGAEDDAFWLLEAGISHAGDMEWLGRIAAPDLALILNAGAGHTDGLGDKGVAWHKTRLLNYLKPGGFGLVNADYPELAREANATGARILWFGSDTESAEFGPAKAAPDGFRIRINGRELAFNELGAPWAAETVLAAIAAATALGIEEHKIRAGLSKARMPERRFEIKEYGNLIVIDDSYNANPLSMRRSLAGARQEAARRRLPFVAVLGEMGELGLSARDCHAELGKLLAELKPALVFWKGQWFDEIRRFCSHAIPLPEAPEDFAQVWEENNVPEPCLAIFKGSRVNRLETYLDQLVASGAISRRAGVL